MNILDCEYSGFVRCDTEFESYDPIDLQAVEYEVAAMAQLIEQGQNCSAVVRRGLAARTALGRIGLTLLATHLREQVNAALTCHDRDCRVRQVAYLAETSAQSVASHLIPDEADQIIAGLPHPPGRPGYIFVHLGVNKGRGQIFEERR